VTIPKLSPTHTKAKIVRFCPPALSSSLEDEQQQIVPVECTDALFVVQCSPDLVTEGFREQDETDGSDLCPYMIVETHEEGDFTLAQNVKLNEWYAAGTVIGTIDDGDDDGDDDNNGEWLWQAYSYQETDDDQPRALNLPPHIATGKIGTN